MKKITEFTNEYYQKHTIILEDNKEFDFTLKFISQQQGWFYNLKFDDFELNGQRLVLGMNILRKYKNILPFGISVMTDDLIEPFLIDDFTTNRIEVNVLNQDDVDYIEDNIYE